MKPSELREMRVLAGIEPPRPLHESWSLTEGGNTFTTIGRGSTAKAAFDDARNRAEAENRADWDEDGEGEYEGGYSGTVAEKNKFVEIGTEPTRDAAFKKANELIDKGDRRIDDKWGPAGAIRIGKSNEWLFFGWASS